MAQLLTEIYNIKNGTFKKKDGSTIRVAYIDPKSSESTFNIKDELKKFGANWMPTINAWGWFIGNNAEQVYKNKIEPCLRYLTTIEQNPDSEERNVEEIIDTLIKELDGAVGEIPMNAKPKFSEKEVREKLAQYKQDIVSLLSDSEFKAKLVPILKFRQAKGHVFSFGNNMLFYIQDPQNTLVKSKTDWGKMNRIVNDDAPALWGWMPGGFKKLTPQQKEEIINKYLVRWGLNDKSEMNPGQKEIVSKKLNPPDLSKGFRLVACFYDVRFTTQMEGKEDVVGSANTDSMPWTGDTEVTEFTEELCDAILQVISNSGVKVKPVKDLGGAQGVSKSGTIEYLEDGKKNIDLFNTLCHEFSHELLHQKFLRNSNEHPNGYGSYFIGTSEGRAKVEQQAELSAWIVCRYFDYDMSTNINYVGLWGLDEKAAPFVFDTVASAATAIIQNVCKVLDNNNINESKNYMINEITGLEVARLIGCEDAYIEGQKEIENDELKRSQFQESFNRWMNNFTKVRKDQLPSRF